MSVLRYSVVSLVGLCMASMAPTVAEARRVRVRPVTPLPTGVSPVLFSVSPESNPWLLRWTLRNTSDASVEVAADRRLVWLEGPPPAAPPSSRGRHTRRRATRALRCVHEMRPWNPDHAVRTRLAPGESYSELVDLRDVCRLRVAPSLFASPVTLHYGFAPFEGRRAPSLARWMARTLVFDTAPGYPVNDLRATITLTAPADSTPPSATSSPLELTVRAAGAPNAAALRATARLRNTGTAAISTLWRTVLLAFEVVTPSGRRVACDGNLRVPNPFREFFVRIGPGMSRSMRVEPDTYCPTGTFDEAGIYHATASFETSADGEPWSRSPAFTGRVTSLPFVFRIARGHTRYVPFGLRIEGRGR